MAGAIRISPEEVRQIVTSGTSLLVCAYGDDEKCKQVHLEGAIFLTEFKSKRASIPKDHEIIFYCASNHEATAAGQAERYLEEGFENIKVLGEGVEGWKEAGYPLE